MILSVNDVPIPLHCLRNKFQLGRYCLALCLLGETAPSVLHFILYVIFMGTVFFFFWSCSKGALLRLGVYDLPPLPQQMLNNCRWKTLTWIFSMQKNFHLVFHRHHSSCFWGPAFPARTSQGAQVSWACLCSLYYSVSQFLPHFPRLQGISMALEWEYLSMCACLYLLHANLLPLTSLFPVIWPSLFCTVIYSPAFQNPPLLWKSR